MVRNHPVGPISPKGKVYSTFLLLFLLPSFDNENDGREIRHSVNLTLMRRASDWTGVNLTVTVNVTRRFCGVVVGDAPNDDHTDDDDNDAMGMVTIFRIVRVDRSIACVLRRRVVVVAEEGSTPHCSNRFCILTGRNGFERPKVFRPFIPSGLLLKD